VIQFPNGQRLPAALQDDLKADFLRIVGRDSAMSGEQNTAEPGLAPGDTVSVQSARAALEMDLIGNLDPHTAPAGAADYLMARTAALASEPVTSMHYLGEAAQQSPAYVSVALHDPAFHAMHAQVQDLASRMNPVGGTDQTAGAATYQPPRAAPPADIVSTEPPLVADQAEVTNFPPTLDAGKDPALKETNDLAALMTTPQPRPSVDNDLPVAPGPPLPAPESAPIAGRPPASMAPPPPVAHELARAASAALDLELLRSWDTEPARAVAANEYQLAQIAVTSGDRSGALQHLEQAILAHPAQAAAAVADPAFSPIRNEVRELVARLTTAARTHAEAAIAEAHEALESAGSSAGRALVQARAYLEAAQSSFQLTTYTGYVQAALAAEFAQRIVNEKPRSRRTILETLKPVSYVVKQAAQRLWRRLPVLAILLGWFLAGVAAALASLPFESGAEFRAWLLPLWAIGMVCMVLYGFVRSIRAATKHRAT